MTEEDFAAWRDHPVTQWFLSSLTDAAALAQRTWVEQSWNARNPDPELLLELRAKAEVYDDIAAADFDTIAGIHEARKDEQQRD